MLDTIKNIAINMIDTTYTRFFDPNNSEISYQYLIVNIIAFAVLLRFSVAVNYLRKQHTAHSFVEALQSIFSRDVFFSRSFRVDVGIFVMNLLIFAVLTVLISQAFTDPENFFLGKLNRFLAHYAGTHHATPINPLLENIIFTLIIFLTYEILYYFSHRAFHYFPVLWQFHKVHHSTTHLNFMTDNRFHALEWFAFIVYTGFAAALGKCICVYFFGQLPANVVLHGILLQNIIFYSLGLAQHSNLWLSFGRFDYLLISPAMHITHHSTNPKNFNTNYALNLAVLDWLFGTLKKTDKKPPADFQVGVGANPYENAAWANASMWAYFFKPFQEAYKIFFKKAASA